MTARRLIWPTGSSWSSAGSSGYHLCQRGGFPSDEAGQVVAVGVDVAAGGAFLDPHDEGGVVYAHAGGDEDVPQFPWRDVPVLKVGSGSSRDRLGHVVHGECRTTQLVHRVPVAVLGQRRDA